MFVSKARLGEDAATEVEESYLNLRGKLTTSTWDKIPGLALLMQKSELA